MSHLTRHTLLSRRATKRPCVVAIHGSRRVFHRINLEALRCAEQPCAFSTLRAVCHGVDSGSPLPTARRRSSGLAFPIAPPRRAGGRWHRPFHSPILLTEDPYASPGRRAAKRTPLA